MIDIKSNEKPKRAATSNVSSKKQRRATKSKTDIGAGKTQMGNKKTKNQKVQQKAQNSPNGNQLHKVFYSMGIAYVRVIRFARVILD